MNVRLFLESSSCRFFHTCSHIVEACEYLRIYQRSNNKRLAVNRNTNQLHDIRCYMILCTYIYVHSDRSRACYDVVRNPDFPR